MIKNLTKKHIDLFKIIGNVAEQHNLLALVIGGFTRDLVIGRKSKDLDFVVVDPSQKIKQLGLHFANLVIAELKKVGNPTDVKQQMNFGTCQFMFKGDELEFVGARKESYRKTSRKPIIEDGTLEDDQDRRDFNMNAMGIILNPSQFGTLVDRFNGLEDIKNRIIQCPHDPNITFSDDPLRMLRAIRFATQLNFNISDATKAAIIKHKHRLKIISIERVVDELHKILVSKLSHVGIRLMDKLGLLELILPEVCALKGQEFRLSKDGKTKIYHKDNFEHVIKFLKNLDESKYSDNLLMKWGGLLHDIGKPGAKRFDPDAKNGRGNWTFFGHQGYIKVIVDSKTGKPLKRTGSVPMAEKIFKRLKYPLGLGTRKEKKVLYVIEKHEPIKLDSDKITDSVIRRLIYDTEQYLNSVDVVEDLKDLIGFAICDLTGSDMRKRQKYLDSFVYLLELIDVVIKRDKLKNFQPPITGDMLMEMFNLKPSKDVGDLKKEVKNAILDGRVKNDYQDCYNYIIKYAETKFNLTLKESL